MAALTPTEYYTNGIVPTFQSASSFDKLIEVPPLASSLIILVKFSADVKTDVVSHALATETEAGTAKSNETLDGTDTDVGLLRVIPTRDEYLINSNNKIEIDPRGNGGSLEFAAVYRK